MRLLREPFNGISHLVGLSLSITGLVFLILTSVAGGTAWHIVSVSIFGASLILLYGASALYHLLPLAERGIKALRKIDHMMIYILIAGSYTPLCLVTLRGGWGWSLFGCIWAGAIVGVVLSAIRLGAPRWLSTAIYAAMGWLVVIAAKPLVINLSPSGFGWLLAGGMFYTVGAVFYSLKWPKLKPGIFGFHELWHLFVMAGSISHYWVVFRYVAAA